MSPSTRVGPRDLGGIAMRLRAQGRAEAATRYATDPRRGTRGRDGLRMPRPFERKDPSLNFRPVLLAGLGDWAGLAEWCEIYEAEGWQLREWNSPTYTARVLTAVACGAALAPQPHVFALREALNRWLDLLALLAAPAPPLPMVGDYGSTAIVVERRASWIRHAVLPAGMRANRWTCLDHGANALFALATRPDAGSIARKILRRDERRPQPPDDPREHTRPAPDRAEVAFACLWRRLRPAWAPPGSTGQTKKRLARTAPLDGVRMDQRRRAAGGDRSALEGIVAGLTSTHRRRPLRTWGRLEVRIQRAGPKGETRLTQALTALSAVTSRNKGAVTAAAIRGGHQEIQAVSPLKPNAPPPRRLEWRLQGCFAEAPGRGRQSLLPWLARPAIDLLVTNGGVKRL